MHVRRCSINMYIGDMAESSKINFFKKGSQPSLENARFYSGFWVKLQYKSDNFILCGLKFISKRLGN